MNDRIDGHPVDLLSEYLDDELDVAVRASIDRHLASCEDCRDRLDALGRLSRAIADESVPPVPVDLATRIGRRVDGRAAARSLRSRFAIPATIAATLGAMGILVALQWREGRFVAPAVPPPASSVAAEARGNDPAASAKDKLKAARPPVAEVKEDARRDSFLKKDPVRPEPSGGLAGAAASNVMGGVEAEQERPRARAADAAEERRERDFKSRVNDSVAPAAAAPAAKLESRSGCEEQWSDSGFKATWEVADALTASGALDRIARDVGGIGLWRGTVDGRPYMLIVPRARFEEVFYALRARDVTGLDGPPALPEGSGCVGISIALSGLETR